ncbi:MAG: ABC transporter ATP-binding protein, partial [Lachnospiraceae bacterium]|nr:ABC transporter ATP-binding protein [Lachnospiraceae bacterium]
DRDALCGILKEVGLDEKLLKRKASELSGGQCQRMSIARALYSEADILLCDEITSALDVSSQAQVVGILKRLNTERKLTAVFVSHDIALLSMLCSRIMVMKDGQVVEQGLTTDVIGTPGHEYTKLLIESARKQSL